MLRKVSLCLSLLLAVSACQNTITPINNTSTKNKKTILTGKVEFPNKFNTKASLGQIITNSTVSLIYPDNYQTADLQGKSIATGLSDTNGNFSLNADYSFDPIIGQIFVLEATKRIKPIVVNNTDSIGDAISMRTYVQWQGSYFKSITKNSIYINTTTTAVAIMASFNTIKPEDTIEKLNIGTNGQVEISDINSNINVAAINHVKGLVETALGKDQDPVGSIYYQQNKILMKDISAGSINKLRGCISTSGNCNSLNVNIPTVTSLDTNTPISPTYLFRDPDIQVNTTTIGNQTDSTISVARNGKKVVTWVSNDAHLRGIFAQRYNADGSKNGNEIKVTQGEETGEQFTEFGFKNVAVSEDGGFMVVWTAPNSQYWGVYGRKFDSNGIPIGSSFLISNNNQFTQNYQSISARGNGDYVVTWTDHNDLNIYAKIYKSDNSNIEIFPVNANTVGTQYGSDVAVATNGNFVITWIDNDRSISAQRFDSNGTMVGTQFTVNASNPYQWTNDLPKVGIDPANNFVIVWHSVKDMTFGYDVLARKFTFDESQQQGSEFIVHDSNATRLGDQHVGKVSMFDSGNFVITWQDSSGNDGQNYGIHAKKYNADGTAKDSEFIVNKYRRKNQMFSNVGGFTKTSDNKDYYSIAWSSYGQDGDGYGIYMQNFEFDKNTDYSPISGNQIGIDACVGEGGVCVKGEQQINSYALGNQADVSIATNKVNGNHVAVWVSENQDGSGNGIFAQMYNGSGQKQGLEIPVNGITAGEQSQIYGTRAVAMDKNGNFVVVWMSNEAGNWQIRRQQFDSSGKKVADEQRVNDAVGFEQMYPNVSMNSETGEYIITWSSLRDKGWDIYAKKYNANGVPSTSEFLVSSTLTGEIPVTTVGEQQAPDVYLSDNGTYIITWGSTQNGKWDVFAKIYDVNHPLNNQEFQVNKDVLGSLEDFNPTVVKDSAGRYIFTYHRKTTTTGYDQMGRIMNASGVLEQNEFIVTNAVGEQGNGKIALLPSDKFIVTWNDLSNVDGVGNKIKAKIFNSDGTPSGSEINVNSFKGNNQYTSLADNQAFPKVSTDLAGSMNIVWTSEGQDGSGKSVHIKRFKSDGTEK